MKKKEYQDIYELKDKFVNFKNREFRKQQIEILRFIEQSSAKVICIQAGCGCLSGDTIINCNHAKNGRSEKLINLYCKFNKNGYEQFKIKKPPKPWNLEVPTFVRSFNGKNIRLHKIHNVVYSGVKEIFRLTLNNGFTLNGTFDHLIMTDNGWVKLGDLKSKNYQVMCDTLKPIKSNKEKEKRKDRCIWGIWNHPYGRKVKTSKHSKGYSLKIEKYRLIYEASLNGLTYEKYISILETNKNKAKTLKYVNPNIYDIHHIDFNYRNNAISNLQCITRKEHKKLHNQVDNFNQGVPQFVSVKSIEKIGFDNTFDIICEDPYHNFVANGIIVHNSGKSLIGMVSGAMYQDCCYLVSSKQLQDQLEHDFPEAKILKGRSNYACRNRKGRTCAECVHTKVLPCGYDTNKSCKYKTQKSDVEKAKFRILNYHYFLHEANHVGKFSDFPVIIADEADMIESLLTDFVGLNISGSRLKELRIDPPKNKTSKAKNGVENWKKWAEIAIKKTQNKRGLIDQYLKRKDISKIEIEDYKKESAKLASLIKNLTTFYHNVNESWILEIIKPDKYNKFKFPVYKFKPIWLTQHLAKQFFWNHANKFILMSATFPPKKILSETLGLEEWEIDYKSIPSSFPKENRPIILRNVGNLSYKTFDNEVDKVINEILKIIDLHINEKGLIHAVSYKLTNLIIEADRKRFGKDSRLITHQSNNREEVLQNFKESKMNDVLISPSLERGVDLPGNQCTFQIIAKAPNKSLADKLTSARLYSGSLGKMWYKSIAAQSLIQAVGRGVRSENDKCITYIVEQQACDLITNFRWLFPEYFLDSLSF